MHDPLFRLVYRSRPAVPDGADGLQAELARILRASRRRNPGLGVTGALMLRNNCFVQALEGPLPALETLFELICRDERHEEVALLELAPIDQRGFDDWAMAWIDTADAGRDFGGGEGVPAASELPAFLAAVRANLSRDGAAG
jgi:hypothetical protein